MKYIQIEVEVEHGKWHRFKDDSLTRLDIAHAEREVRGKFPTSNVRILEVTIKEEIEILLDIKHP